ncbi:MAG: hypothetical protein E7J23_07305, partial [Haemophilus parainfluenzae]|nr:hypothetical protein [Haemophilus parainfluenzae]
MARVDNYEQRFGGIGRLYTPEGLARLRQAHVCVIGIGGVGGALIEQIKRQQSWLKSKHIDLRVCG